MRKDCQRDVVINAMNHRIRYALLTLTVLFGCSPKHIGEDPSQAVAATVDCSHPAPDEEFSCAVCKNDKLCASCLVAAYKNPGSDTPECKAYCEANPDSTLCVKQGDCYDAEGKPIRNKPGCYWAAGAGGAGQGGASSASGGDNGSGGDSGVGAGGASSSGGAGGDPTSGVGGDDATSSSSSESSGAGDGGASPGCDTCATPAHRAQRRLSHRR